LPFPLYSLFYAYFPYQRFCSLAFSSFPSLLFQRPMRLKRAVSVRHKRKRMYHKTVRFVKRLFSFFQLFFHRLSLSAGE
ncbi:hypothetical protein, partial [Treponema vincentii]|uniref:hypothetical protein n=1 Tax=Treponema vincentii TaxID=69710 RepID=UPI003D8B36C0